MRRKIYFLLFVCISLFISCSKKGTIESLQETNLFTLDYGNFEEQISIADLNKVGGVRCGIAMRDGFFYIVDGYSSKIMELNSYGDLLTVFYNEDSSTAELISKSTKQADTIHQSLPYPFEYPGLIAVDSQKCVYATGQIDSSRQEISSTGLVCNQVILRFERDGSFSDYIGQQGPGGTPFPLIKNIYITQKDELVVICCAEEGFIAFWYGKDGFLKYTAKIDESNIPKLAGVDVKNESYLSIGNVIPDPNEYKLFINVDYYVNNLDEDSLIQTGVNYVQTLLYALNLEKEIFEEPISIPPYEDSLVVDYSKLNYNVAYDFLGITNNGWKYFLIKTSDGFNIEMIQTETQKILRRHFAVNHTNNLYFNMHLSSSGIITAFYLDKNKARVVWYRTDNLIDALVKS